MTRLLMTADTVGGVWTYALELADALAAHGVEVHLATMGPRMSPAQRDAVVRSAVVEVAESEFALEWMDDPWLEVDRAGTWLLELERDWQIDVVHLNGYAHAALPWRAPAVVVAHSDVLSWWRMVRGEPAPPQWWPYRERVRAGLRAAAEVVAPTAAVLADLSTSYGYTGGLVIPNGRRSDWVRQLPKEPLILGAGRAWDEAKGLQTLVAATDQLPWPVVVAGAGGSLGELSFPQLADLLSRAAVFVAPATYEPFGLGILEAALAGCALVLGDIPSLREIWRDAATYVPPGDVPALTSSLGELIDRRLHRDDMAARARTRAQWFSPERSAAGYAAVYARVSSRIGV